MRRLPDGSKGLFCTRPCDEGRVLLNEPPLVATRYFACPVPACRHCLSALRTGGGEDVGCPGGCGHRYCSEDCADRARQWYHACMCSCSADDSHRGTKLKVLCAGREAACGVSPNARPQARSQIRANE